jgi:hypothetical protein
VDTKGVLTLSVTYLITWFNTSHVFGEPIAYHNFTLGVSCTQYQPGYAVTANGVCLKRLLNLYGFIQICVLAETAFLYAPLKNVRKMLATG